MKQTNDIRPGTGCVGRCLVVLGLVMIMLDLHAQSEAYDPDQLFKGVQFSLDHRMVIYPGIRYVHITGFHHNVVTRSSMAYEFAVNGEYYVSKNYSFGMGFAFSSPRIINFDILYDDASYFNGLTNDPDILEQLSNSELNSPVWSKNVMTSNMSLNARFGYHQFGKHNANHRVDYYLALSIRKIFAYDLQSWTFIGTAQNPVAMYEFYSLNWHYNISQPVFDIQPYIGYSYVLKNQKAFSFGLMANLSLARQRDIDHLLILEETKFEESGHFLIRHHYAALQFGYIFTRPNKYKKRSRK